MAVMAAPHPPSVFRVLKQAWRDWLASGNAQAVSVATPPDQTAVQGTTVTGSAVCDASVPVPVPVTVQLVQGGKVLATATAYANKATGAFSVQFKGGILAVGTATAHAAIPYGVMVASAAFNVT